MVRKKPKGNKKLWIIAAIAVAAGAIYAMQAPGAELVPCAMLEVIPCKLPSSSAPHRALFAPAEKTVSLELAAVPVRVPVDSTFTISLILHPSGTAVNVASVRLEYPPTVALVKQDESASPFGLRIKTLAGGTPAGEVIQMQPNPGVADDATLGTFIFSALRAGTATITIASSSEVLANDGFGTDVLKSTGAATIVVF